MLMFSTLSELIPESTEKSCKSAELSLACLMQVLISYLSSTLVRVGSGAGMRTGLGLEVEVSSGTRAGMGLQGRRKEGLF